MCDGSRNRRLVAGAAGVFDIKQWRRSSRTARQRVRAPGGVPLLSRRVRHGRPHWLLGRILVAVALPVIAYVVRADDLPAWITLAAGSITWFAATAHLVLAPKLPR